MTSLQNHLQLLSGSNLVHALFIFREKRSDALFLCMKVLGIYKYAERFAQFAELLYLCSVIA